MRSPHLASWTQLPDTWETPGPSRTLRCHYPQKSTLEDRHPWGTAEVPGAKSPANAGGVGEEELMNSLPRALTSFCPELKRAQTAFSGKHPLQVPTLPLGMSLGHVPADSPRAPGTSHWLVCCQPVLPDRP